MVQRPQTFISGIRRLASVAVGLALVTTSIVGCSRGAGPQAASINLDDAQAAFLTDHRLESVPARAVEIEPLPHLSLEDRKFLQDRIGASSDILKNVVVDADFTGEQKKVTVQADLQLDAATVQRVTFQGQFQSDGKAYLRNLAFPYLLLVAQCLRDCQSVLLHVLLSEMKDGKSVLLTEQMVASATDTELPPPVLPDFTPSSAKLKLPDFSKDVVAVGNYPPPLVDQGQIQALVPRPTTVPTVPQAPVAPPPVSTGRPVVFDEVQGPGVVIGEFRPELPATQTNQQQDFPLPLMDQYSGRAEGCYAVFLDPTNAPFCQYGGSLSFANLIPERGLGFTRYSKATHAFGSGLSLRFVEVLTQKTQAEGVELKIGNLSAQRGGLLKFSDGSGSHTAHQNGLEVDLSMPFRNPVSSRSQFRTLSSAVDYPALWKVIRVLSSMKYQINGSSRPIVNRVYLDRRHIRSLCSFARTESEKQALKLLQHIDGHTTHLHIRLEVTPHNPSAKEVIVRPAEQVCTT